MIADRLIIELNFGNESMQTLADALEAITRAFADDPLPGPLVAGETARILDTNGNTIGTWQARTLQPELVTLREHPDAADNTVADACEHCGLFSCCGECLDDAPHGRCACGKALDSNGEHGGGYGAFCGGRDDGPAPKRETKLEINPDPLKIVSKPVCVSCRRTAPWCSCGKGDYQWPDGSKA